MIILGIDPGPKNFGLGIIQISPCSGKITILGSGMLKRPITTLIAEAFTAERKDFVRVINKLLDTYQPEMIVAERFMVRLFGTLNIEIISVMLATIALIADQRNIPFTAITAAQWKNTFNRKYGKDSLKQLYVQAKKKQLTNHRLDACLLAIFIKDHSFTTVDFHQILDHPPLLAGK